LLKRDLNSFLNLNEVVETVDQMHGGFLLSSIDGRIFYANQAVERISGVPLDEIVGKSPKEMEEEGLIEISIKVSSNSPITMIHKVKTGKEVFITSKPVYDENGSIICFVANYQNLKELSHLKKVHQIDNRDNVIASKKQNLLKSMPNWIGNSFITYQLKEQVMKIAATEAIVLIYGDSGSGKEVVADYVHQLSKRKDNPYLKINCGAIPEDLIESELFGYEKGAFTGATKEKKGLFEAANGGTILLDEIGEIPLHLQVKLLRVVQTKKITRVGGTNEKTLDIRIIAATNKNLHEAVKQGTFREDLFYRLHVIPITLPPLEERKDDILPLSNHFLQKYNQKHEEEKTFAAETLQLLQEYSWPGNIRELENLVERLVLVTEKKTITADYLPLEFKQQHYTPVDSIFPLRQVREEAEVRMIRLAISKYKTLRKAAEALNVHHSTLIRKMNKYHISQKGMV